MAGDAPDWWAGQRRAHINRSPTKWLASRDCYHRPSTYKSKLKVGKGKSFNDIHRIVEHIYADLANVQQGEDTPQDDTKRAGPAAREESNRLNLFPNIEFLPTLHPIVLEDTRQHTSQKKRGNTNGG